MNVVVSITHLRLNSFTGNNGTCVEVAALLDGHIAVRNSTHRDQAAILSTRAKLDEQLDHRHQIK
jgi:hypothetical protein